MSVRKVNFVDGEYYHIYNRGNSKQKIFNDLNDYLRFISLLYISNTCNNFDLYELNRNSKFKIFDIERGKLLVNIGAYCLMPNHFHILIIERIPGGISKFMQKLSTAYSMYYNKKHKRSGALFEGKFKAQHINNDRHLKYIYSYIHLNPIKLIQRDWKEKGIANKIEAIKYLNKYSYSSYLDFIGDTRSQNKILNTDAFPKYFPNKTLFRKEIFEWLSYNQE
jgi:putative transposase